MEDQDLELYTKDLKALSNKKRIEIIEEIIERGKRISELEEELGLSKSTIYKHLEKLRKSNLVKKRKEGKKSIYYDPTKKLKRICNEKKFKIILNWIIPLITIGVGIYGLISSISSTQGYYSFDPGLELDLIKISSYRELIEKLPGLTSSIVSENIIYLMLILAGLILLVLLNFNKSYFN